MATTIAMNSIAFLYEASCNNIKGGANTIGLPKNERIALNLLPIHFLQKFNLSLKK